MSPSTPRFIVLGLGIAALGLAGCANTGGANGLFGETATRPKTILVADFLTSPEVEAIDRGFSARMDRKGINYPILERKRRTLARVNDEIVASTVATLREAGLEAQPGSEDTLSLKDDAIVVSGQLRAADPGAAKNNQVGFGSGRSGVIAEMTITSMSGGGKKQLLSFSAESGRRPGAPASGKLAASRNAAIASSLAAANAVAEKLRPMWKHRRAASAARRVRRSWFMRKSRAGSPARKQPRPRRTRSRPNRCAASLRRSLRSRRLSKSLTRTPTRRRTDRAFLSLP